MKSLVNYISEGFFKNIGAAVINNWIDRQNKFIVDKLKRYNIYLNKQDGCIDIHDSIYVYKLNLSKIFEFIENYNIDSIYKNSSNSYILSFILNTGIYNYINMSIELEHDNCTYKIWTNENGRNVKILYQEKIEKA